MARGHQINQLVLVSPLDLIVSLAAKVVYGLLLLERLLGEPRLRNNVLALTQPASEQIKKEGHKHPESVPFLSEREGRGPWKPQPLNQSPEPNTI